MSTTQQKNKSALTRASKKKLSPVVVVTRTTEKDTLFPEKLEKAKDILRHTRFLNS